MNTLYNLAYFEHLLRKDSQYAELINGFRWKWISEVNLKHVLDFGSGVGWFRAWRPKGVEVDTFDINEKSPTTGILRRKYDMITFWDVLEHIPNLGDLTPLLLSTRYVAMSVPLLPKDTELKQWKHYRPGEHLRYFQMDEWDRFFDQFMLERLKVGYPECPPREDIVAAIYKRT